MDMYRTRPRYVEAEQIDETLRQFLIRSGYDNVKLGDYYLKDHQGRYMIFPKTGFEALYEKDGE